MVLAFGRSLGGSKEVIGSELEVCSARNIASFGLAL